MSTGLIYRERDNTRRQYSIRLPGELLERIKNEARRLRTSPAIFIEDLLIDRLGPKVEDKTG